MNSTARLSSAKSAVPTHPDERNSPAAATTQPLNIHYIYINRKDLSDERIPDEVVALADMYCKVDIGSPLMFRFWTYSQLCTGLHEYDDDLARLFRLIDPDFAACLADIGRIYCLFAHGGIYHDARYYIQDPSFLLELRKSIFEHGLVLEKHPIATVGHGCRNTNMAGLAGNSFFDRVLKRTKANLLHLEIELSLEPSKLSNMWALTTMTFLEQLLEDQGLSPRPLAASRLHRHAELVIPWQLVSRPKFYNNGMANHWSTLQQHKPLMRNVGNPL